MWCDIWFPTKAFPIACELVGPGGCRGPGWDSGNPKSWPKSAKAGGDADGCCQKCLETKGCTAFHVTTGKKGGDLYDIYRQSDPSEW